MASNRSIQSDLFGVGGLVAVTAPEPARHPVAAATIATAAPAVAGTTIKDAGAELVYNRRNRSRAATTWADVADFNDALKVKEVVKANVWPKPDYEKLIREGMEPILGYIIKQVYDAVASKPMLRQGRTLDDLVLKSYISGVNRVEAGLMQWVMGRVDFKLWAQSNARLAGAMLGSPISFSDLTYTPSLLDKVYPGGVKLFRTEAIVSGGNKLVSALMPEYEAVTRAIKAIKTGWPSKREAWEVQGYRVVEKPVVAIEKIGQREGVFLSVDGRYMKSFDDVAQAEEAKSALKAFALFGKRGFLHTFDSEAEAVESVKLLIRREKGQSVGDKGQAVGAVEREGVNRRMEGEDISSERLVSEFGLKGVNFGNWLKTPAARAEAQLHLNHAFDSLHDLAEILGVPARAMSLNGMLGLAIGAQGGGLAAAHFVPGVNEINLTRTSGAGSLAHEWAHALDHYYATQGGLAVNALPFLTEHADMPLTKNTYATVDGKPTAMEIQRFGELRPEIIGAFKGIVAAMDKRPESQEEADAVQVALLAKSKASVGGWLASIRREFVGQEAEFDALASRVVAGDLGDGLVALSKSVYVAPALLEMRTLYKQKNGRPYSIDNLKNLQSAVDYAKYLEALGDASASRKPQSVASNFAKSARNLDREKGGKPYWSTKLEKFARAFDAFVSDELEARLAKNGYLSHTARSGDTVPVGTERTAIGAAFRGLVAQIQVRETEQGVALFSATGNAAHQGLPLPVIHAEIRRLRAQWPSMPSVTVVHAVADLPFASPANADGAYADGKVYVVAGNIADIKQLQKVMAHECVMHHSLLEMLGAYGFSKLHHGMQKLKAEGDPTVCALAADILARYGVLPPDIETKEMVALAGEQCLDSAGNVRVAFGFMKSVFAGVAGWLRDHGIAVPFSNTELQGIMHAAGEWVKHDVSADLAARGAGYVGDPVLNSFGGIRAETAPLDALRLAREMHITGVDDRAIWRETGWTFGFADGKPRFEISDDQANVVVENRTVAEVWDDMVLSDAAVRSIGQFMLKHPSSPLTAEVNSHQGVRATYARMTVNDPATAREIESYLEHQALYAAYPELAKVKASQLAGPDARHSAGAAAFVATENRIGYASIQNADQFKSVSVHELQHAIQQIEGFSLGGVPQQFGEMDLTAKELGRINLAVASLYEKNPSFAQDSAKASDLQARVVDKYGDMSDANEQDVLVQDWWHAVNQRDSHAESGPWFALKSLERRMEKDRAVLSPQDQYERLAGEVEARLAQARLDMSPAERLADYPIDQMDVMVKGQVLMPARAESSPVDTGCFVGKVLDVAGGVVIQKINRAGVTVRHNVARLSSAVDIGEVVEIKYADGVGAVRSRDVAQDVAR
jgi:Large polyvalent protein associated domain 23/Large polyvalent protein-associated domain 1